MTICSSIRGRVGIGYFLLALALVWLCGGVKPARAEAAGTNRFRTGPAPGWVKPVPVSGDETATEPSASQGEYFVLVDRQINAATEETYSCIVKKITSQNGVQNGASVELYFEPAFQDLTVHFVRVIRDGQIINKLDVQKFKLLQQETGLERHMFNGTLSAVLFLEDIRIGDTIEYASTAKGANPILKGRFVNSFMVDWGVPLRRQICRLLWPVARNLTIKNHKTDLQPSVKEAGGIREYIWEERDTAPVIREDSVPIWYDVFGWVQLTEFSSWQEVADWARPLYAPDKQALSEALLRKITLWQNAPDQATRVQNALRFVQDEVRYLGIEIGVNSHQPNDAETVFARRFGDCKDKVHLFCTILDRMGIEAHPVLVHSYLQNMVDQWAPSPFAFNHVVAQVKVGDAMLWVDPTLAYQRGPLTDLHFPDYARGLVVAAGSSDLVTIPLPQQNTLTTRQLTFRVTGYTNPVSFEIVTVRHGGDADAMRAELARTSREELEKYYLNRRARLYPKITTVKPMQIQDDEEANVVTVTEDYRLADMWELSENKKKWTVEFYAEDIYRACEKPETSLRSQPLSVYYPRHLQQTTSVFLPDNYAIPDETNEFKDTAVSLVRKVSYSRRELSISYDYVALANVVSVPEVTDHLEVLKRIRDCTAYGIQYPNGPVAHPPKQPNWSVIALATMYSIVMLGAAFLVYHYRTVYTGLPPVNAPYVGLNGWLAVVALVLLLKPIMLLRIMIQHAPTYSLASWNLLTTPGAKAYKPAYAPVLLFELLANLTFFIFSLLLLVLFFQKRYAFPNLFIIYLCVAVVLTLADHTAAFLWLGSTADTVQSVASERALFGSIWALAIWSSYIKKSQRVKATFVN